MEPYLRITYDAAPEAVFVLDSQSGAILDASQRACVLYGYSRAELVGRDLGSISSGVAPSGPEDARDWMNKARGEGPQQLDWQAKDKGGRLFMVVANLRCATVDGEPRMLLTVHDLGGQRTAEELLEERLRFETLLSDLSAALISSCPSDLSAQINLWLGRVVESLRIDRATIFELEEGTGKIEMTYSHIRPGSGAPQADLRELAILPWYMAQILRGERLVLAGLPEQLPKEAAEERAYCKRRGLKSHLTIPLRISGSLLGALCICSFQEAHAWPETLVQRLEFLGQIFANALHRYRTARALEMSETRLQLAMDAAAMGTWELDLAANRVSWSPQVAPMYGLAPGTMPLDHESYMRLTHPDDRRSIEQGIADCVSGKSPDYRSEHRVFWPDGSLHWIEGRGRVIRGANGRSMRLLGTVADITERKRSEEAARESHQMYETLVNTIDGIVWEVDVASFMFTYVSPQAERILGYPLSDWLTKPDFWVSHLHEEDRSWALAYCVSATQEKRDHEFQYRIYAADGRTVWLHDVVSIVLEEGRLTKLRGIMVDVTARKEAEEALRKSESHFRAMFEEAPIGLVYSDATFRISKVNRAFCELIGYTEEELRNKTWLDVTHPEDADKDAELAAKLFRGEIQSYQLEKRYLKKGGEIVWVMLTATVIRDKDGAVMSALGMIENITGRKAIEDQLRQAQKMEALGRLAGGIAHDFNNLLTAIKGYSEISITQLPKGHWLRANLEEINQAGDRAAALTRQLLAFGRKQVRRPKLLDLSAVVDDMHKMLRRLIGENIKLVISMEPKLGAVLADRSQIEQVIVNLVVNARDAMPKGGMLTIELANVYLDQEYVRFRPEVSPGHYVVLSVSDTGFGMSRAVQQRIFEPFFTTKEPGMGTGLGLPTVYGIVKQSEGHIWVYSEEGVGSRFKIYLPCAGQPTAEPKPVPVEYEVPGGAESILLVEDDDSVRSMVLRILGDKGYSLVTAHDGQEALQLCEREGQAFDLLVTDVIMPKMGGRELSEKLRLQRPKLKVLYLSGYAHDEMVHHGVLDDGVALLEKPFTKDELLRKVREVLSQA